MSSDKKGSGESMFLSLLTILFIGLKLTGYIKWSWWWVLSPIWISFAIAMVFVAIYLVMKKK